jgi:hypothetical protein
MVENAPEEPALATGLDPSPTFQTVQLMRVDVDGSVTTITVRPEMVGDYLRAGWSKSPGVQTY